MDRSPTAKGHCLGGDPRLEQLRDVLQRVQARFRLQEALWLALPAVALGLGASAVVAVVWRFTRGFVWLDTALLIAGFTLAALLTVSLFALLRPRDLLATARRADRLLALDERLSTALEAAKRSPANGTSPIGAAQLDDAIASVQKIAIKRDLSLHFQSKWLVYVAFSLALLLAVIFVPNPTLNDVDRAARSQIAAEQQKIDALKQAVEAQPGAATDPKLQQLLNALSGLSKALADPKLSREQALSKLSEAESRLQKSLDAQAPAQREALDQLAKQLAASPNQEAKQAGEALQSGDPEKAAQSLEDAGKKAAAMSPDERKALAQSLKDARNNVAALDPEMARKLNDAANALENNNAKAAEDALKSAADQVRSTSQQLATQQQLEQALAQIQQSKNDVAQAGATPISGTAEAGGTALAQSTAFAGGTAFAVGTTLSGTSIAPAGSPVSGTAIALSTGVAGTPGALAVNGQAAQTGTPVVAQGAPGSGGTPVVAQGQGQGQPGGQASNGGNANGQPASGWGKGRAEPVYAPPSSVNAAQTVVTVQGQDNPSGEQSSGMANTNANSTGAATVPYEQVYGQYQQAAGNALNSDYIPQGYKDLVKDYFSNIAPQQPTPQKP
ncbi:MAG: hypothetical protein IVW55_05880 [Chloroflexi bacterium]|nr:hypothetical protein [Chloroflexota bacterium]